jgi:hypothetical protein
MYRYVSNSDLELAMASVGYLVHVTVCVIAKYEVRLLGSLLLPAHVQALLSENDQYICHSEKNFRGKTIEYVQARVER